MENASMYIIWKKLQRLQPIIKEKSNLFKGIKHQIEKDRYDLKEAKKIMSR